jgi:hypothetical protein
MTFAIATQVKLPATARVSIGAPPPPDLTQSLAHFAGRELSFAEQRAMRGLERVRAGSFAVRELERGLARLSELLMRAEHTPWPTLVEEVGALLGTLGQVVGEADLRGVTLAEGGTLSVEVPVLPERSGGVEQVTLALPDVAATLFDAHALCELDADQAPARVAARSAVDASLRALIETRVAFTRLEQQLEGALRTLSAAREPTAHGSLSSGTALHVRAEILTAAARALKAQANPSARAVMLLEAR